MAKPWEKYQQTQTEQQGPWNKYSTAQQERGPGIIQRGVDVYERYKRSPLFKASPLGMAQTGADLITRGFERGGERIAEELGERQIDPRIAAGVGTAVSMIPDIAMTGAGMAGSATRRLAKTVPDIAVPFARRAIGKTMTMLKTPYARREANLAAKTALEEGIVPRLGSPDVMFERASDLARKTGQKIGQTLGRVDFWKLAPDAELDLERTRQALTRGTKEGVFSGANKIIDDVKTTISQLYGRGLDANTYNAAKNELANSINYLADQASKKVNKKVANTMATTIRNVVKKLLPESYDSFLENQRLFSRATSMTESLNPELARQMGNRLISPYSVLVGMGQLAAGQPGQAAASIGIVEPLMRRGAGVAARMLTSGSRALPTAAGGASAISNRLIKRRELSPLFKSNGNDNKRVMNSLPPEKAREYLQRAGGDKRKAREMALNDGWRIR